MLDLRTPESGTPVPPSPPEPGRELEPIAQPEEDLSDLLETTTPDAVGSARVTMLLESLESDLTVNQYGSVLHLLTEAVEERRALADSNLLLEALAAIAREAGQGRDKARRTMTASTLARSISADTVAYLSAEMAGASTAKQSEILALLGWLGRRGMAALCALAQDVDPVRAEKATHVIVERDAPDFLNLRYLLSQASADEMERIISVIIARGEPAALAQLGALTDHPRVRTRLDLVRLIHQSQRPELLNILMSLLGDPSAEVRLGAVNALAERVTSTNISALCDRADTEAAFGEAGRVKEAAVKALGRMRVPEAVPILSHLLSSPGLLGLLRTPRLRVAAAHALAQIGTAEARQALENGAQDRQRAVRDACRTALMRLDVTSSGARHSDEAPSVF
jgi:HEAT repeat protein